MNPALQWKAWGYRLGRRVVSVAARFSGPGATRWLVQLGRVAVRYGARERRRYAEWVQQYDTLTAADEEAIRRHAGSLASRPLLSVLVPVYNPSPAVAIMGNSICLGNLLDSKSTWHMPRSPLPDGSFSIIRSDDRFVELLSDVVGSRTVWYILTEEMFLASTSQRAIVHLLGSFEMNRQALSWFISAGNLGPENAWDRRIRKLEADARLTLDRNLWSIGLEQKTAPFRRTRSPNHGEDLMKAIESSFSKLEVDLKHWVLPLSGGFDSRSILLLLKDDPDLRCITWGLRASLHERGNDASVAAAIAGELQIQHRYYETDLSDEDVDTVFSRFIGLGEGRIDHIAGYMDGFAIWKMLYEEGVLGIIRGDEGFGWKPVATEEDVRRCTGLTVLSDFSNLRRLEGRQLETQTRPKNLRRQTNETIPTWRDRLYHQFRIPTVLASLTELKSSYVEITSPLLTRTIVNTVRQLPDRLRTDKTLFRRLVRGLNPGVPFAKNWAIENPRNILRKPAVAVHVANELESDMAGQLFGEEMISDIRRSMMVNPVRPAGSFNLKKMVPRRVKSIIRNRLASPSMDVYILAARMYIATRICRLMEEDATKTGSLGEMTK